MTKSTLRRGDPEQYRATAQDTRLQPLERFLAEFFEGVAENALDGTALSIALNTLDGFPESDRSRLINHAVFGPS